MFHVEATSAYHIKAQCGLISFFLIVIQCHCGFVSDVMTAFSHDFGSVSMLAVCAFVEVGNDTCGNDDKCV